MADDASVVSTKGVLANEGLFAATDSAFPMRSGEAGARRWSTRGRARAALPQAATRDRVAVAKLNLVSGWSMQRPTRGRSAAAAASPKAGGGGGGSGGGGGAFFGNGSGSGGGGSLIRPSPIRDRYGDTGDGDSITTAGRSAASSRSRASSRGGASSGGATSSRVGSSGGRLDARGAYAHVEGNGPHFTIFTWDPTLAASPHLDGGWYNLRATVRCPKARAGAGRAGVDDEHRGFHLVFAYRGPRDYCCVSHSLQTRVWRLEVHSSEAGDRCLESHVQPAGPRGAPARLSFELLLQVRGNHVTLDSNDEPVFTSVKHGRGITMAGGVGVAAYRCKFVVREWCVYGYNEEPPAAGSGFGGGGGGLSTRDGSCDGGGEVRVETERQAATPPRVAAVQQRRRTAAGRAREVEAEAEADETGFEYGRSRDGGGSGGVSGRAAEDFVSGSYTGSGQVGGGGVMPPPAPPVRGTRASGTPPRPPPVPAAASAVASESRSGVTRGALYRPEDLTPGAAGGGSDTPPAPPSYDYEGVDDVPPPYDERIHGDGGAHGGHEAHAATAGEWAAAAESGSGAGAGAGGGSAETGVADAGGGGSSVARYTGDDPDVIETIERVILQLNLGVSFDDIASLQDAKRLLNEAVVLPLLVPEFFTGIREPWKGVLLFGPPGTGKTMLARAVASINHLTFFNCSAASLVSKWRGESEKLVRCLFDMARHYAPSIVFIDEVDALVSARGGASEHEASRRFKTQLLTAMDGITSRAPSADGSEGMVMVLATSNTPWDLDEAFRRRFEKRIYIPLPDLFAREDMLRLNLRDVPCEPDVLTDDGIGEVAALTRGYSGSDIHNVCREASMKGMRRLLADKTPQQIVALRGSGGLASPPVSLDDLREAVAGVKSSVAGADVVRTEIWAREFQAT